MKFKKEFEVEYDNGKILLEKCLKEVGLHMYVYFSYKFCIFILWDLSIQILKQTFWVIYVYSYVQKKK